MENEIQTGQDYSKPDLQSEQEYNESDPPIEEDAQASGSRPIISLGTIVMMFIFLVFCACFIVTVISNSGGLDPGSLKITVEKSDGTSYDLDASDIKHISAEDSTITIRDISEKTDGKIIYLDGYNLGVSIPKDSALDYFQYEYRRFSGTPYFSSLIINGATKKSDEQAIPDFVAQNNDAKINSLGSIVICRKDEDYSSVNYCKGDDYVYSNKDVTIYYRAPQAVYSVSNADWEAETTKAIKDILTNKNNYIVVE